MQKVRTEGLLRILIGVTLAVLAYAIIDSFAENVVAVNDKAPDFTIVTDNGSTISPSDFGGQLLVVNFWATWCPPCVEEMPSLNEFQKLFADSGVVVLGISVDQDEGAYRDFLGKVNVSFLTARDPTARISAEYGTFMYPETYVINRDRRVVLKYIGARLWTDESIIQGIRSLL